MTRSTVMLLLLLAPLVGCDECSDARPVESASAPSAPAWFPAAPFRDDIRLPEASQARPWQPPAKGPVPVVEILRDGGWLLDGEPVEGTGQARIDTLRERLRQCVIPMPKERLAPDYDSSPWIPSNPVLVRVDRDAPWGGLRAVIETCHDWRVQISRVELVVATRDTSTLRTLPVPMARDFGTVCVDGGAWVWTWLLLEEDSTIRWMPTPSIRTPAPLAFLVADYVQGQPQERTTTEDFDSAAELTDRLEALLQSSWREVSLDLPYEAPSWVVVAALDLGTLSGIDLWGFPPLPDAPRRSW